MTSRRPTSDDELRYWLENMVWGHGYNDAEVSDVLELTMKEAIEARERYGIRPDNGPARRSATLPYPGGRHPRLGFQDGAVRPQRETKFSAFLPWDAHSYVVVDLPEALWSNRGLSYLAHRHLPTLWDQQGISLETLEWDRCDDGSLVLDRTLPDGVAFTTRVVPGHDHIGMQMALTNGSDGTLTDLRVQICVMLKAATGFNGQTNDNKLLASEFVAVHDAGARRWIICAWHPNGSPWGNEACPCLHSDPKFPDLEPDETGLVAGWLSFYEGEDVHSEVARIEKLIGQSGPQS